MFAKLSRINIDSSLTFRKRSVEGRLIEDDLATWESVMHRCDFTWFGGGMEGEAATTEVAAEPERQEDYIVRLTHCIKRGVSVCVRAFFPANPQA